MTIDETAIGRTWLNQFPAVEREVGRQLVRSLRLVSHTTFISSVGKVLDDLFQEFPSDNFALFNVTEASLGKDEGDRPRRVPGSSSDLVKNLNENFARLYGPRVQAHPTLAYMKTERMKNVVLVEDFIGTGGTIASYLRYELAPTIKSWISYQWTKLWIVSYAGLEPGIRVVLQKGYGLNVDRVRLATAPQLRGQYLSPLMVAFCKSYAKRTSHARMPLGFKAGAVGMIFEHSCPNNAPVILWSKGRRYKPLFPNRGIPTELKPLFSQEDVNRPSAILWDMSQYRLALTMLREPSLGRQRGSGWSLLLMLGLASRNGWNDLKIAGVLGIPVAEAAAQRLEAYKISVLDQETNLLTSFGRHLLNRLRSVASEAQRIKPREQQSLAELYYPQSCDGLVRD